MPLLTFLRGSVTVDITGVSIERFLNLAAHRGVNIWNVSPVENGLRMHCPAKHFKKLKNCAKKTNCRIKITHKTGFPFIIHKYRERKILMGGIVFFILFLYAMSSFIWLIDILGNERVPSEEILKFSKEHNLRVGAFKYSVNHKELSRAILSHFPDIGWADVHTKGTRTTITVSETLPKQPLAPLYGVPCNIVAAEDGLITSIATAAGIPKVRQNDIVREGDILVSGIIPLKPNAQGHSTTLYVHAYAEVWAKMYTPIRFAIPMSYTYKVFTGNERRRRSLQILAGQQKTINLFHGRISFTSYDKIMSYVQPGASGDYPLPFIWITATYREFTPETRYRSVEQAMAMADRVITDRVIREFDFHTDIIDKQVEFIELPDKLAVSALITTNQRIDKAVPINGVPAES